jgi:hypothetical protein
MYGRMPYNLFKRSFENNVHPDGTRLKLSGLSRSTFPIYGTASGQRARAERASHIWGEKTEMDCMSVICLQDKNDLPKQENCHKFSILLHTDGFYPVKVSSINHFLFMFLCDLLSALV